MPIRPENKARYPKNWKEIRERIKARAGNKCEICGVENRIFGFRNKNGTFVALPNQEYLLAAENFIMLEGTKIIEIVCTVMHLDHTPEHNEDSNLKFGCQKCHNNYDAPFRAANRKKNREVDSGQASLDIK